MKFLKSAFFVLTLSLCAAQPLLALDVPKPTNRYVNDYANMLSGVVEAQLNSALQQFEDSTSNQVVVLTFQSLEEESLEDFTMQTAELWRAGQKKLDNGVMLFIFKDDRKIRIEVGYGLEGALPDALAGQIIQNDMAPFFREGRYESGILAGVSAIVQATQGEYKGTGVRRGGYSRQRVPLSPEAVRGLMVFALIMVALFFIIDLFRFRGYGGTHRQINDRYSFWEWWFRFGLLLMVLSILFRVLFYSMLFSRGGYSSGGGGGFSGGGGGFGGGGASGGW